MSDDNSGSFIASLGGGESGNPAGNGIPSDAPPIGIEQSRLAEPVPTSPASPKPQVAARPEWVKEKFWDHDKGEVKLQELSNSYNSMEKYLGNDKVPVPKDPNDKIAWDMYYKAGGVPDSAEAYEFKRVDDLPSGLPYDEELEKSYRNFAHATKLNPWQAQNLYDAFAKHQVERHMAWQADQKQSQERLGVEFAREYGASSEGVKQGVSALMSKYADPDFKQMLDESGYGNDLRMVRMMARIAKDMNGSTKLKGTPEMTGAPRSTADLEAKIADFRKTHHKVLMNSEDAAHGLRRDQLFKLHEELVASRGSNTV